jgi:DNA-binding NarL/FixJ family response regulator
MGTRRTASTHLFVDARSEPPARWREAFRSLRVLPAEAAAASLQGGGVAAAWLRLQSGASVDAQLDPLLAAAGSVPVLVLSDAPQDAQGLQVLALGARAYCNSHAAPAVLQRAWATVEAGGLWVGEALMLRLVQATAAAAGGAAAWPGQAEPLSAKEQEVLDALVRGEPCRAVAQALGLSERTVRGRMKSILRKADVSDRFALTRKLVCGTTARAAPLVADR